MNAPANLPPRPPYRNYPVMVALAERSLDQSMERLAAIVTSLHYDSNALEARIRAAGDDADMSEDVLLHRALCDDARVLSDAITALRRVMANVEGVQLAAEDREKMAAMVAAMEGKR